jgi:hypothetical protein
MSDVKQAVKTSTKIKWQNRWTISESGRQLYDLIPMVGNANHLHIPVYIEMGCSWFNTETNKKKTSINNKNMHQIRQ